MRSVDRIGLRAVRDRALLATECAFTVASATEPDMPLTWVNPAFTATTGYPYEEAVGRNCRFLQGEGTDAVQVAALHAALQTGRDGRVVLLNYRKDGTAFWNEVTVSPVRDAAGALPHFVGVQTDVTARVEAERSREQALRAERTARAEAEQTREKAQVVSRRMSVVAEATGLLAATLDVAQSLDRLARLVVPLLADWVVIHLTDEHGRLGGPSFLRHRDGRLDLLDRYRELVAYDVAVGTVLRDLLAGGPPMLLGQYVAPSVSELGEREREMLRISLELGATSLVCVPLTARRTVMGTMMLVQGSSGRAFDTGDLDLVADLGRRAGLAVDNARLYTQARTTALALQRSLLPVLPEVPGLTLAADYLPAHQDSQVGGDWWDVFALPDGATGLAVGDVMGHDIAAAAAMGQLRSVLRTCAWAGDGPAEVLARMDRLVQGFEMAQLATCFYARLVPADGSDGRRRFPRLCWSNAGHLPPVVLGPDGQARLLQGGGGAPIGVPSRETRAEGNVTLAPGSTLLLYTDGLVETRTGDIDSDIQRLLTDVAGHRPTHGPQALVDRLVIGSGDHSDDIALLAVHVQ